MKKEIAEVLVSVKTDQNAGQEIIDILHKIAPFQIWFTPSVEYSNKRSKARVRDNVIQLGKYHRKSYQQPRYTVAVLIHEYCHFVTYEYGNPHSERFKAAQTHLLKLIDIVPEYAQGYCSCYRNLDGSIAFGPYGRKFYVHPKEFDIGDKVRIIQKEGVWEIARRNAKSVTLRNVENPEVTCSSHTRHIFPKDKIDEYIRRTRRQWGLTV